MRVLTKKCKRTLESERTYFYHAIFVNRFHQLPKLSSSQSLEVQNNSPAAAKNKGEEVVAHPGRPRELLEPTPRRLGRVKSLREMPGPSTLYNLYEFFWKDGFGRIHEIQVHLTGLFNVVFRPGLLIPFLFSPHGTLLNHRAASTAARRCREGAGTQRIRAPHSVSGSRSSRRVLALLFRVGAYEQAACEPCRHPAPAARVRGGRAGTPGL